MGEHSLSARMQQKTDTAANWAKATNFVPKKGEIIIYSDGGGVGVPKIKVGDGTTKVGELKFVYETSVSNTVENGTTDGPKITTTVNGISAAPATIPIATATQSGVVSTGEQTFAGNKTLSGDIFTITNNSDVDTIIQPGGVYFGKMEQNGLHAPASIFYSQSRGGLVLGQTTVPALSNIFSLGGSSYKFKEVYATNFRGTADTASKLETPRTISLVSPNIETKSASFDGSSNVSITLPQMDSNKLSWRGDDIAGDISPVDALADGLLGGNRGAGITDPDCVLVEYSQDGGETWQEYETDPGNKIMLLRGQKGSPVFKLGGPNTNEDVPFDLNHQLRITIMPKNTAYFSLQKILILHSGMGLSQCKIETAPGGPDVPTTGYIFSELKTTQVSGWSGWNSICLPRGYFFGGTETTLSHTIALRFTFWQTEVRTQSPNNIPMICRIFLIGAESWESQTNLGATGHLYSYDWLQNATFPAQITATKFNGPASSLSNSLTLNGNSFNGSTKVSLSSQQLGVPSAFIAKSVSVLDCNSEKIGRVLSSHGSNSLVNGPSELGSTAAGVLWNIPALMSPTSSINGSGAWQYLHQVFITGGGRVYLRSSASYGTAGNWSYGEWAKVLTDKNFASTVKLTAGGVNLLTNTKSFINGNYTVKGALQSETYNGFAVRQGVNSSDDAALIIQYSPALEANKSYTLSFWAKGSGSIQGLITGYSYPCSSISSENTVSTDEGGANTFPLTSSWKRYWITFTMGNWSSAASGKVLWLRARTQDGSGTVANVCGLKWENGNVASDWTPALDDQKIGGTNYLPNLLLKGTRQNITATYDDSTGIYVLTGNGSTNTSFPQLYTLSLPCENLVGKTCIFHVNSITASSTALEPRVYVIFQDSNGIALATGLVTLSTSSTIINVPSTATSYQYIIRLDQNKAHATTDTVIFRGLKLEVGNTPTDWSPAPEDALQALSIGGTNLLENSNFSQGGSVAWGACPVVQKTGSDDLPRNFVNLAYNAWSLYQDVMLKANTRYTLSMDARLGSGTGESPVTVKLDTSNIQLTTQSVTSGYFKNGRRVYVSFTYGSTSQTERIYIRSTMVSGRSIQVANIKLEEGNRPTDWTPAPEDVQHETSSNLVLQSTAWTGSGPYSAVLSCSHITASNTVIVSMAAPVSQVQYETFCKAQITAASQTDGSITFTAYGTKPTINLPIAITTLGG